MHNLLDSDGCHHAVSVLLDGMLQYAQRALVLDLGDVMFTNRALLSLKMESNDSYDQVARTLLDTYENVFKVQRAWMDREPWVLEGGIMSDIAAINDNMLNVYADAMGPRTLFNLQQYGGGV